MKYTRYLIGLFSFVACAADNVREPRDGALPPAPLDVTFTGQYIQAIYEAIAQINTEITNINTEITNITGSLGNLLAYGEWFNTTAQTVAVSGTFQFPTATPATSPVGITASGAGNQQFTATEAGLYLVLFRTTGSASSFGALALQHQPAAGGGFTGVSGGAIPTTSLSSFQPLSIVVLVTLAVGDQLQVVSTGSFTTAIDGGSDGASITFVRIHG